MFLKIQREILLKLFKLALSVINEKKISNNIVGTYVLLVVENRTIKLVATDLDTELIVEDFLPDFIEAPGKLVVPFRKINDICRAMHENTSLQITASQGEHLILTIESDKGFFKINYLSAENFPVITDKQFNYGFLLQASLLQEMLNKASFAMGDDESRHFLNGMYLQFNATEALAVAADGHRLMLWGSSGADLISGSLQEIQQEISMLIPRKSVFDILKILAENPGGSLITIRVGANHFRLEKNHIIYTSKLLNAAFPSYKKLIPVNAPNISKVDREELRNACIRAVALLGDKSSAIKLKFKQQELIISGSNEQGDLVQEKLFASLEGKELEICFNIKYLIDFLCNCSTNQVIFRFENAISGVLIQDLDSRSSYVLMPMQL